jgi:hypothetical protein
MDQIRVNKKKLLKTLKENRRTHRENFEIAMKGWKEDVIEALREALDSAEKDDGYSTHFDLPKPVSYEESYDEAIDQVEWSENVTIMLGKDQFNQLVRDKWNWQRDFQRALMSYTKKMEI